MRRAHPSRRPKDFDNGDNDYHPAFRLDARRLCRRPSHQPNSAAAAYAPYGGDKCHIRNLPRRLVGAGRQRRGRCSNRPRHNRSCVRHGEHRRRLSYYRSNAVNVQAHPNRCSRNLRGQRLERRFTVMSEILIQLAYLFAAFLFITALRALGRPDSARRGMQLAAFGMAVAILATLFQARIVSYQWILFGAAIGAIAGYPLGMWVPMTAMPQRIALSHAFGALAATLVGIGEYTIGLSSGALVRPTVAALGLEVLFGGVTVTGSLIAFGKLQGILPGRPLIFRGQNAINLLLLALGCCCLAWLVVYPPDVVIFAAMVAIAVLVGTLFVLPIGGADMPVIVSILNSYAGLAAVATGFAIDNNILIIVGALDGLSGLILAIAMSKAMNRSFSNVLFGAFGSTDAAAAVTASAAGEMSSTTAEDAALHLAYAQRVIMVPGYGLAVSQAQHQMRALGDLIEKRGGKVRYT